MISLIAWFSTGLQQALFRKEVVKRLVAHTAFFVNGERAFLVEVFMRHLNKSE